MGVFYTHPSKNMLKSNKTACFGADFDRKLSKTMSF
jgi:hypothetical protein